MPASDMKTMRNYTPPTIAEGVSHKSRTPMNDRTREQKWTHQCSHGCCVPTMHVLIRSNFLSCTRSAVVVHSYLQSAKIPSSRSITSTLKSFAERHQPNSSIDPRRTTAICVGLHLFCTDSDGTHGNNDSLKSHHHHSEGEVSSTPEYLASLSAERKSSGRTPFLSPLVFQWAHYQACFILLAPPPASPPPIPSAAFFRCFLTLLFAPPFLDLCIGVILLCFAEVLFPISTTRFLTCL